MTDYLANQTFGVELEFLFPPRITRTCIARKLQAAGIAASAEHYNHETRNYWKMITDASLGYQGAGELVSPVLTGIAGLEQVAKVCEVLTEMGCTINRSCGMHVHVGMRDADFATIKRLFLAYAHFELAIDSVLPKSRRGSTNTYCGSLRSRGHLDVIEGATSVSDLVRGLRTRYLKLNPYAFAAHGTIEFRHHSGTVDPIKTVAWIRLCLAMSYKARHPDMVVDLPPVTYRGKPVTITGWPTAWSIVSAMHRPEGATDAELRALAGGRAPDAKRRAGLFGFAYRYEMVAGVKRHYATAPAGFRVVSGSGELPAGRALTDLISWAGVGTAVAAYLIDRAAQLNI